eukprot:CAMPEP_0170537578 /NCGR_PEP_ID=MMETSP0209-20121228/102797_1 /TAXON_ID=665100 ORGANISM="Litonotus pictus, Strain P1" /NCGR_SAMPLE_ID=MMETSP0209 /ASSEMBLY_ACC=CAM_ASM_000301 /LENGTH=850 /DNA_ID=CAMNT_0010839105 /DNA_START=1067 /DNA_END=3619 /DNA_ORIENTATION=+
MSENPRRKRYSSRFRPINNETYDNKDSECFYLNSNLFKRSHDNKDSECFYLNSNLFKRSQAHSPSTKSKKQDYYDKENGYNNTANNYNKDEEPNEREGRRFNSIKKQNFFTSLLNTGSNTNLHRPSLRKIQSNETVKFSKLSLLSKINQGSVGLSPKTIRSKFHSGKASLGGTRTRNSIVNNWKERGPSKISKEEMIVKAAKIEEIETEKAESKKALKEELDDGWGIQDYVRKIMNKKDTLKKRSTQDIKLLRESSKEKSNKEQKEQGGACKSKGKPTKKDEVKDDISNKDRKQKENSNMKTLKTAKKVKSSLSGYNNEASLDSVSPKREDYKVTQIQPNNIEPGKDKTQIKATPFGEGAVYSNLQPVEEVKDEHTNTTDKSEIKFLMNAIKQRSSEEGEAFSSLSMVNKVNSILEESRKKNTNFSHLVNSNSNDNYKSSFEGVRPSHATIVSKSETERVKERKTETEEAFKPEVMSMEEKEEKEEEASLSSEGIEREQAAEGVNKLYRQETQDREDKNKDQSPLVSSDKIYSAMVEVEVENDPKAYNQEDMNNIYCSRNSIRECVKSRSESSSKTSNDSDSKGNSKNNSNHQYANTLKVNIIDFDKDSQNASNEEPFNELTPNNNYHYSNSNINSQSNSKEPRLFLEKRTHKQGQNHHSISRPLSDKAVELEDSNQKSEDTFSKAFVNNNYHSQARRKKSEKMIEEDSPKQRRLEEQEIQIPSIEPVKVRTQKNSTRSKVLPKASTSSSPYKDRLTQTFKTNFGATSSKSYRQPTNIEVDIKEAELEEALNSSYSSFLVYKMLKWIGCLFNEEERLKFKMLESFLEEGLISNLDKYCHLLGRVNSMLYE